ncbi:hypothetical protein LOAG_09486, partial [Loa loa]
AWRSHEVTINMSSTLLDFGYERCNAHETKISDAKKDLAGTFISDGNILYLMVIYFTTNLAKQIHHRIALPVEVQVKALEWPTKSIILTVHLLVSWVVVKRTSKNKNKLRNFQKL